MAMCSQVGVTEGHLPGAAAPGGLVGWPKSGRGQVVWRALAARLAHV